MDFLNTCFFKNLFCLFSYNLGLTFVCPQWPGGYYQTNMGSKVGHGLTGWQGVEWLACQRRELMMQKGGRGILGSLLYGPIKDPYIYMDILNQIIFGITFLNFISQQYLPSQYYTRFVYFCTFKNLLWLYFYKLSWYNYSFFLRYYLLSCVNSLLLI